MIEGIGTERKKPSITRNSSSAEQKSHRCFHLRFNPSPNACFSILASPMRQTFYLVVQLPADYFPNFGVCVSSVPGASNVTNSLMTSSFECHVCFPNKDRSTLQSHLFFNQSVLSQRANAALPSQELPHLLLLRRL